MARPSKPLRGGSDGRGFLLAKRLTVVLAGVVLALAQEAPAEIVALNYDLSGNEISQQTANASAPIILGSPVSQIVGTDGIGGFSVNVSSTLPVTYQWYFNGTAISGAAGDSLLLPNPSSNQDGSYTVVVTNASGSVTSSTYLLGYDANGNGLPDGWEMAYFGNLNQTAGGDYDGDSILNVEEYYNGTNPTVREVYHWAVASGDFNTASNWVRYNTPGAPARVPGVGDTAVIDSGTFTLPANTTITASQVTVNAPFTVPPSIDYVLTISGNWVFSGTFTLAPGRQFAVTGGGIATVVGLTGLSSANLFVNGGAKVSFPSVSSYTLPAGVSVNWTAHDSGSELRFPNLATISGSATPGGFLDIVAQNGGKVLLPLLTAISKPDDGDSGFNSGVRLYAIYGGELTAPLLNSFQDNDSHPASALNAYGGGVLALPQLTAPVGVNLELNAESHPEQFTSLVGTTSLRINSGTITFSNLATISSLTSLVINGGAKVSFPSVSSYTLPAGVSVNWTAHDSGSELRFPNLATISGSATPGGFLDIVAQNGGKVLLPLLTAISKPDDGDSGFNSGVRLYAIYGGELTAPLLNSFQDNDSHPASALNAYGGGVLALPQLTAPVGVNLELNAESHPEQFTSLVGTTSLRINSGTITFSNLATISSLTSLVINGGAKVSFPSVSSYTLPAGVSVNWTAHDSGSELRFPNLATISGSATPGGFLDIVAQNGGKVLLPLLTAISKPDDGDSGFNSGVRLYAIYGGELTAPLLNSFQDNDSHPASALNAYGGGVLALANLTQSGVFGITISGVVLSPSTVVGSTTLRREGGNFRITLQTFSEHTYQLQQTESLDSSNWLNLGEAKPGVDAPLDFVVPLTVPKQFFRVKISPWP